MPSQRPDLSATRDLIDGFLEPLLEKSGLDLEYELVEGGGGSELINPDITVDFSGPDVDLLLEQRGELLLALEQLTLEAMRVPHQDRHRVVFDAEDYRLMRIEELRMSAKAAAEKVKSSGRPFYFQPMTSRERRIIHVALNDDPDVRTASEGLAPRRRAVVYPVR